MNCSCETITWKGWIAWAVIGVVIVGILGTSPDWGAALGGLIVVATTVLLVHIVYTRRLRRGDNGLDDHFARMFAGGLLPMTLAALVLESLLVAFGVALILGLTASDAQILDEAVRSGTIPQDAKPSPRLQELLQDGVSPRLVTFGFFTAYAVAACVEEGLKWLCVRVSCCCGCPQQSCCLQPQPRTARGTIAMFFAVAAGFSTTETLLYVRSAPGSDGDRITVAFVRLALALPLHIVASGFTASRLATHDVIAAEQAAAATATTDSAPTPPRKACLVVRALVPAILIHGTYDFIALGMPVLFVGGESGSATPGLITLFCVAVVTAVSAVVLLREVKALLLREDTLTAVSASTPDGAAQQASASNSGGGTPASGSAVVDTRGWSKDTRTSSTVGVTAVSIELGPTMVDSPASSSSASAATEAEAAQPAADGGAGDGVFGAGDGIESASLLQAGSTQASRAEGGDDDDNPQRTLV